MFDYRLANQIAQGLAAREPDAGWHVRPSYVFVCRDCGKLYGSASALKYHEHQWCEHCGGELEEVSDGN